MEQDHCLGLLQELIQVEGRRFHLCIVIQQGNSITQSIFFVNFYPIIVFFNKIINPTTPKLMFDGTKKLCLILSSKIKKHNYRNNLYNFFIVMLYVLPISIPSTFDHDVTQTIYKLSKYLRYFESITHNSISLKCVIYVVFIWVYNYSFETN